MEGNIETLYHQGLHIHYAIAAKNNLQEIISFITLLIISFQTKQRQFLQAVAIGEKGANFLLPMHEYVAMDKYKCQYVIMTQNEIDSCCYHP